MARELSGVDRRSFITGIATAGAAVAGTGAATAAPAEAAPAAAAPAAAGAAKLAPPSAVLAAAETGTPGITFDRWHVSNPGSDYMSDVFKSLKYKYLATMPGSTFRGIHESFINHGMNEMPELISVHHEEISAAVAHGYAKAAGQPMVILVHNTVGLQHASMAIYNAFCDRVPMMVLVGNLGDTTTRRPGVEWYHTATDVAAIVRGYIKHDASPVSLRGFGEETMKAHSMSVTPPFGPVLVTVDGDLAENPAEEKAPPLPAYSPVRPPVADPAALADVAKLLVGAQNPVIVADRVARTPDAMAHLVQLAELLQIPVIDTLNRPNFPNTHHLFQPFAANRLISQADVVLGLDVSDLFGIVADVADLPKRETRMKIKPGTKVLHIASLYMMGDGNYQDQQRFYQPDMAIAGDSEASLPYLIDAVQRATPNDRRTANAQREAAFRTAFAKRREADLAQSAIGWDASPISVARMCAELWNAVKHDEFTLVSSNQFQGNLPHRLWTLDKHYHAIGGAGGYGVGYGMPAAVGGALGARDAGRYAVNIQGDGDLLCQPGSLWTAAKYKIPLLTVVHNNRGWHQEVMHVQRMADRRERHPERAHIGTAIDNPNVDFAKLAQSYGVYAEGPITDSSKLGPALARAVKLVRAGQPVLLDVVSQGR